MEYAKKSALGGYKALQDDIDATHVVLTVQDYRKLQADIQNLQRDLAMEKTARQVAIENEKEESAAVIERVKKEYDAAIDKWRQYAAGLKQQLDYEKGLNENLRRISRERANADRKLKPKTEHTGFAVLFSKKKPYKYRSGRTFQMVDLWETVIETPFSVEFTGEQVETEFHKLFEKAEDGHWPISRIGISARYIANFETMKADPKWKDVWKQYNIVLEELPKRNFKSGYWEVTLTHTAPLGDVPQDMRPA